jgi:molybdopterin-binding protein
VVCFPCELTTSIHMDKIRRNAVIHQMKRLRLLTPREAAEILGISFPTIKKWIYRGKLRTVRTPGGHHRIPEADIAKYLRATLGNESRDNWTISSRMISESNQLAGRILGIQVDGVVAQVTMSVGRHRLTSIISSELASDLHLKTGDNVVALVKSSQVMILRNQV